jgi:hypothetical protein
MAKRQVPNPALVDIVADVVRTVRPEETILVSGILSKSRKSGQDDMLGWGVGPSEVVLLTPFLIQFFQSAPFLDFCKKAGKGALDAIAEHLGKKAAEKITESKSLRVDTTELESLASDFVAKLELNGFNKEEAVRAGDCVQAGAYSLGLRQAGLEWTRYAIRVF